MPALRALAKVCSGSRASTLLYNVVLSNYIIVGDQKSRKGWGVGQGVALGLFTWQQAPPSHTNTRQGRVKTGASSVGGLPSSNTGVPPVGYEVLLHHRAFMLHVTSLTRFGKGTCLLESNSGMHAGRNVHGSSSVICKRPPHFYLWVFGGLAAMCKAELNSGDQTPELLSPGQNLTTATSKCEAQSFLVRPEVVFLLAGKTHSNCFSLPDRVSAAMISFKGCSSSSVYQMFCCFFFTLFDRQELKQNLRLWGKKAMCELSFSSPIQEKTSWLPKEFALHGSNHLKEVLNREETSVQRLCCK